MKKICYIPIDNRPVLYKRMILCAKASGIDLLIPDNDIVMTALDYQPLSSTSLQYGNIYELKKWYSQINHASVDGYIISSDMFIYGGLVNSRYALTPKSTEAKALIDYYLNPEIINNKPVILIDSLMRLASTAGFANYNLDEYENIRSYGLVSRYPLKGDYSLNDIISHYEYDYSGELIPYDNYHISLEMKNRYLQNRKNKLIINDYLIDYVNKYTNIFLYLGIDDSNPSITIQTNEINYLRKKMQNGLVFTGIDELPLLAMARLNMKWHNISNLGINFMFFGGREDLPGDPYDNGTIKECLGYHLEALGVHHDSSSHITSLMLTYNEETHDKDIRALLEELQRRLDNNEKVMVMDLSGFSHLGKLEEELIKTKMLLKILSYSNWNTIANAIGITLGQGLSRLSFINDNDSADLLEDEISLNNYLQLQLFSYVKDILYKIKAQKELKRKVNTITNDREAYLNFYKYHIDANKMIKDIIINEDMETLLKSFRNKEINGYLIKDILITNYTFPWYRVFEMDFDCIIIIEKVK